MNGDEQTSTRRAPGEGSVFPTVNGGKNKWCASTSYMDSETGERKFVRGYGDTPTQAMARRSANLQKRLKGHTPTRAQGPTIRELLDLWLDARTGAIQSESQRKYRRDIEHHVIAHIGNVRAQALTEKLLRELFWKTLPKITPSSAIYHTYTNLNAMLNWATKNKPSPDAKTYLALNPLTGVTKPEKTNATEDADEKWINYRVAVIKGLLNWVDDKTNPYYQYHAMILFLAFGMRRSELLGLSWKDINKLTRANDATMVVRRQLARHEKEDPDDGWYLKQTKNKKERVIYLPELWRKALLQRQRMNIEPSSELPEELHDLVFLRDDGRNFTWNDLYRIYYEILNAYLTKGGPTKIPKGKEAEIKEKNAITPHRLRHVAASLLFEAGIPIETVQDFLGHSTSIMSLYYRHQTRQGRIEAATALGDKLIPNSSTRTTTRKTTRASTPGK